jgi:hypothetical protein
VILKSRPFAVYGYLWEKNSPIRGLVEATSSDDCSPDGRRQLNLWSVIYCLCRSIPAGVCYGCQLADFS